MQESFLTFLGENLQLFLTYTGVYNATPGHLIMILVGLLFIFLAIKYEFEPMLLIPIGFGILIGNIPFKDAGLQVGIYEQGSVLNILYQGVTSGWYPPLIFLGIGAMTDFSALISNPKLMLIGAAAQFGIFGAYTIALQMGFEPNQAGAIGIIGGADGPTAIFLSSKLAPNLMGAIAVSAYSYMALVPIIQPPFMLLGSVRFTIVRYAILRKLIERKWRDSSFGRDCSWSADRYNHDLIGYHGRCFYPSYTVLDIELYQDLRSRCVIIRDRYLRRCIVR